MTNLDRIHQQIRNLLMRTTTLLAIVLCGWIIGGSYLYIKWCCATPQQALIIEDNGAMVAYAKDNLLFNYQGANLTIPESTREALQAAVNYVGENPGKLLMVNALIGTAENNGDLKELGNNRAAALMSAIIPMGLDSNHLVTSAYEDENLPKHDQDFTYNAALFNIIDIPRYHLNVADGNSFETLIEGGFSFLKNGFEIVPGLQSSQKNGLEATSAYLQDHPNRKLTITGFYHSSETNTGVLPSLGLARANQIKAYLLESGVSPQQIEIADQMDDELLFPNDHLFGGIAFTFDALKDKVNTADKAKSLKDALSDQTVSLNFETNATSIDLTEAHRSYFALLVQYLDNDPNAKVKVVGHTDSRGRVQYNQKLSEERALFIKQYLIRNGLSANQILTEGKGARDSVQSNQTDSGRLANRRVEVFIE